MQSDIIIDALMELRIDAINKSKLVELELEAPTDDVIKAITESGGVVGDARWEQWCQSGNCAHNSHDEGNSFQTVFVPKSWVIENRNRAVYKIFETHYRYENVSPILIIPTDVVKLVWYYKDSHWAGDTQITEQFVWDNILIPTSSETINV